MIRQISDLYAAFLFRDHRVSFHGYATTRKSSIVMEYIKNSFLFFYLFKISKFNTKQQSFPRLKLLPSFLWHLR